MDGGTGDAPSLNGLSSFSSSFVLPTGSAGLVFWITSKLLASCSVFFVFLFFGFTGIAISSSEKSDSSSPSKPKSSPISCILEKSQTKMKIENKFLKVQSLRNCLKLCVAVEVEHAKARV